VAKRCKDHRSFKEIIDVANGFMNYDITYHSLPDNTHLNEIAENFERMNISYAVFLISSAIFCKPREIQ
jgi:hypothetical protein